MLDRFTSMQVFVQVVSHGSLSAAARGLGLSPTMVTKHIGAIEERLGVVLLHRTTRRLSLTDAGRRYLEACRGILSEVEEAEHAITAERDSPRGRLRLNVPVSFAIRHVAPLIPAFTARYPNVSVELGLDDRRVDLVEDGWDMALRIRALDANSLRARHLARIRFVLCAAPAYLARQGTPRRVVELEDHACLGYTLGDRMAVGRWGFGKDAEHHVNITGPLCANNGDALREAALAGLGIIYQPIFLVADELRAGSLHPITLDYPPSFGLDLHAVYLSRRRVPLKVRAMIDYLVASYSAVPPWERDLPAGIL